MKTNYLFKARWLQGAASANESKKMQVNPRITLIRFACALLLFLTFGIGNAWGALSSPYECTFTAGMSMSGSNCTTGDVTWTVTTTTGKGSPTISFGNQNSQSCIKFGSGKSNYYSKMTLTTSAFSSYNVSSVVIYASSNNGGSKTFKVTQGATQIGTGSQSFSSTTWVTNITRNTTSGSGGDLSIEISSDATATFVHSIKVTYSAPSCTVTPTVGSSLTSVSATVSSITATVPISAIGGCNITENGLVYSTTNSTPTVGGTNCTKVTTTACGSTAANKTVTISDLTCGQSYYVRGYATNAAGTSYTNVTTQSTSACPKYTVTLKDDDTELEQATAGASVNLPSRTGCTGYTFAGWTKSWASAQSSWTTTAPTIINAGAYTPTADEDLYPVYTKTESGGVASYQLVTSAPDDWSGTYLIVDGTSSNCLDGSLETVDGASNYQSVSISNNTIASNNTTDGYSVTISPGSEDGKYYIQTASGYYIGSTAATSSESNELLYSESVEYDNTITYSSGTFTISGPDHILKFFYQTGQSWRFRYYKSTTTTNVRTPQLYKKVGGSTTYYKSVPNCCTALGTINGTVSLSQLATPNPTKLKATWTMNASTGIDSYDLEVYNSSDVKVKTIEGYTSGADITGLDPCTEYYVKLYTVSSGSPYCAGGLISTSSTCTTNGYTITYSKSDVTLADGTEVTNQCSADDVTVQYTADSGFDLPASITVTNAGAEGTGWDWDSEYGILYLYDLSAITGNVTVTIEGVEQSTTYQLWTAWANSGSCGSDICNTWNWAGGSYFSQVGSTNEWRITNFTIPEYEWDDVNSRQMIFNVAGKNATNTKFYDLPIAVSQGTASVKKGALHGAKGTLRIFDNSGDANGYIGFIPNKYIVRFGTHDYVMSETSSTVWETAVQTLVAADLTASSKYRVGVTNSSDGFVAINENCPETAIVGTMGQKSGADTWGSNLASGDAGKTGKFRIWLDNATANWTCHFVPYWHITYSHTSSSGTGSGSMDISTPVSCEGNSAGRTVAVAANGFTAPYGKQFKEWRTNADGTGTKYDPADDVELSSNITLYAIWEDLPTYSITYNVPTCASVSPTSAQENVPQGYAIGTLPTPTSSISLNGNTYTFDGWSASEITDETTTAPTKITTSYVPTDDTELYAVYKRTADVPTGEFTLSVNYSSSDYYLCGFYSSGNYFYANTSGTPSTLGIEDVNGDKYLYYWDSSTKTYIGSSNGDLKTGTATNSTNIHAWTITESDGVMTIYNSSTSRYIAYNYNNGSTPRFKAFIDSDSYPHELTKHDVLASGTVYITAVDCREEHDITVSPTPSNGTVTYSGIQKVGETITLSVTPAEGYATAALTATYNDGSTKTLTLSPALTDVAAEYTFTMPDYNVTVSATFAARPATPTISHTTGKYAGTQSVTINCETGGATIYYTTDGSAPTSSSSTYSSAISVSSNTTIKAIAYKSGAPSLVATSEITILVGTEYVAKSLSEIWDNDEVIYVGTVGGSSYAMQNNNGATHPSAYNVTDSLTANSSLVTKRTNVQWNITQDCDGKLLFYPNGTTSTWLYNTNANDGVKVGTGDNKKFVITSSYLQNETTSRYIGIYNGADWRSYDNIGSNSNIKDQTFTYYVKSPTTAYISAPCPATLTGFSTTTGTVSDAQSFTIKARNITSGNVTVTAPTDFEVCLTENGTYTSSITLTPSENSVALTTIYVRVKQTATYGNKDANVTIEATGATTRNVNVKGTVNPLKVTYHSSSEDDHVVDVTYNQSVSAYSPAACASGKVFLGWASSAVSSLQQTPIAIANATGAIANVTANVNYYAVFASQNGNTIATILDEKWNVHEWDGTNKIVSGAYSAWKTNFSAEPSYSFKISSTTYPAIVFDASSAHTITSETQYSDLKEVRITASNRTSFASEITVKVSANKSDWTTVDTKSLTSSSNTTPETIVFTLADKGDYYVQISVPAYSSKQIGITNIRLYQGQDYYMTDYSTTCSQAASAAITWENGGGSIASGTEPSAPAAVGDEITLPTLSKADYRFDGWKATINSVEKADVFAGGDQFKVNHPVTFTAQWTQVFSVSDPTNGLTSYKDVQVTSTTQTFSTVGMHNAVPSVTVADGTHFTMTINSHEANGSNEDYSYTFTYQPDDYGTGSGAATNTTTATVTDARTGVVSSSITLRGRSLPEEFVIAVKKGDQWVALPSNLASTNAQPSIVPLPITVNDATTPTAAVYAPTTTVYKAMNRGDNAHNTAIRFTTTGSNYLQVSGVSDTYNMWLSNTNSANVQDWQLQSSDFNVYALTIPSTSATKKMGIYSSTYMGYHGSPNNANIYLLPIGTKYSPVEATATEWSDDAIGVTATTSATKLGIEQPDGTETDPVTLTSAETNHVADFDGDIDFTGLTGETILLKWYDGESFIGGSEVTVPSIIAAGANDEWSDFASAPTLSDIVVLSKPMTVNVTNAKAKRVVVDKSGSKTGQLDISAGKELVVAETVRKFDGTNFGVTGEYDLTFGSDKTNGLGALVMGSHDGTNKATVNFYSKSHGAKGSNESVNQFVGTPFNDETNVLYNWYNSWIYEFTNTGTAGWNRIRDGQGMTPFHGYCIISADNEMDPGHMYWQQGTLVASDDQNLTLTFHSNPTENMFANSWMAPIKISEMNGHMANTTATVYIFNSGSEKDGDGSKNDGSAGNYSSYTPGTAGSNVIPAMQAFTVYATAAGSLSLDYSAYVYDPAVAGTTPVANKAPQRTGIADGEMEHLKLRVASESGWGDVLDIYIREDFGYGFELYYDGPKIEGDELAPMLYAVTDDGKMAINCVPDAEGTVVGFRRGEDAYYLLTFDYDGDEVLYLNDLKEQTSTPISGDKSYSFYSAAGDMQARFIVSRTPIHNTPTGVEDTDVRNQNSDVRKLVIDDHVFIIRNGQMYDVTGKRVTEINK